MSTQEMKERQMKAVTLLKFRAVKRFLKEYKKKRKSLPDWTWFLEKLGPKYISCVYCFEYDHCRDCPVSYTKYTKGNGKPLTCYQSRHEFGRLKRGLSISRAQAMIDLIKRIPVPPKETKQ